MGKYQLSVTQLLYSSYSHYLLSMDHTKQIVALIFQETAKNEEVWRWQSAGTKNGKTLPILRSACKHLAKCEDCDGDLLQSPVKSAAAVHWWHRSGSHDKWQQWHKFHLSKKNSFEVGESSICFRVTLPTFECSCGSRGHGREKKEEYLAENRENYCLRTCVETKLNPFQAFGFINAETNNSLFKTDLSLWLISCCTDPAWSSPIRYFLSKQPILFFQYMDGLKSFLTQWTSNIHYDSFPWNRQLLKRKCAHSNNWKKLKNRLTSWPLHATWINPLEYLQGKGIVTVHFPKQSETMNLNLSGLIQPLYYYSPLGNAQ